MKEKKDKQIGKKVATLLEGLVTASDFTGEMAALKARLMEPIHIPSHELIIEAAKPEKPAAEKAAERIKKMKEIDSQMEKAHEFHNKDKERELKKTKTQDMSTKNEMLSQIKKNASDIASKSEALKKKFSDNKKDATPTKKDIVAKKFSESKPVNPTKKETLEKKKDTFNVNKKDILGDRGQDKKAPDKIKTELKPDKPKLK